MSTLMPTTCLGVVFPFSELISFLSPPLFLVSKIKAATVMIFTALAVTDHVLLISFNSLRAITEMRINTTINRTLLNGMKNGSIFLFMISLP